MLPEERTAVLIFLSVIAAVFVFAIGSLIRIVLEKSGKIKTQPGKLQIWFRRASLGLAAAGIFCFLYGYFIEPYWLTTRKVEIRTGKLAANSQPIRIVHISDLHSDPFPRLEEKLPEEIAKQDPDIIVYSGDSLNSPEGLPVFRNCLDKISKIAPTYVVRGNWDVWYWSEQDLFGNLNVTELDASAKTVMVKGNEVWLAGIPVGKEGRGREILGTIPDNRISVFLYHYPDEIEHVAAQEIDLYFAGHTHGGQVAVPFYGALMTLSKYGKRFEGGTYQVNKTWLNVNRGIGMEGGTAPRVRFWAWPEITVVDLIPN